MPVKLRRLSAILFLAAPCCLRSQTAPDLAAILQRLDRLERENQALTEEVKELRARLDGTAPQTAGPAPPAAISPAPTAPAPNAAPPAAPQSLEDQMAVEQQRIEEMAQAKVEASEHFPIRLTGMALFNAFLDSRDSGGVEYPVVAATPGAGEAGATLRQTIIGLDFRGPATFWGGTVHGNVYMDFFNGTANTVRMRTGEIEIDWLTRSIMVGVEKPIFNPREPSSLAQVGVSPLTGAGNLWLWLPQVRLEQDLKFAEGTGLRAQMGVIETREVGPYAGSNFHRHGGSRPAGPRGPLRGLSQSRQRPPPGNRGRLSHQRDPRRRRSRFPRTCFRSTGSSIPCAKSNSPGPFTPGRTWRPWAKAISRGSASTIGRPTRCTAAEDGAR